MERKISLTQKHWCLIKNGFFFTFRGDDVTDDEYNEFYKSISKDSDLPLAKTHFTAEGEVTFKSILYVPKTSPHDMFSNYGKKLDAIKVSLWIFFHLVFCFCDWYILCIKIISFLKITVTLMSSISDVCQESVHHRWLWGHDAQIPQLHQGSCKYNSSSTDLYCKIGRGEFSVAYSLFSKSKVLNQF